MSDLDETQTQLDELIASGELSELSFSGMHPIEVGSISFYNDKDFDVVAAADALDDRYKDQVDSMTAEEYRAADFKSMIPEKYAASFTRSVLEDIDFTPGQMGLSDPTKSLGSKNPEVGIT